MVMTPFKKTQETIQNAAKTVEGSSQTLMIVAGIAVAISVIALVIAVNNRK
jgi:uncharacterized membrane protein